MSQPLKRMMLVVNPVAGRKASEKSMANVCRVFLENGWLVTPFVTGKRNEATEYVRQYGRDFDRIACMGGDGTFNEVINGYMQGELTVPVAFIPCGSTNDFATTHGISFDIDTAAKQACVGEAHPIDVCQLNERYFTFHSAFGFFANVVNTTSQDLKNTFGYFAYLMDGAMDITRLRSFHAKFTVGDQVYEGDYLYGGCLSTTTLGGNLMSIKDTVKLDDGQFECLLIQSPADLIELGELVTELTANTLNGYFTRFFEFSEATVEFDEDPNWCVDGEPYQGEYKKTLLKVHRQKLPIIS